MTLPIQMGIAFAAALVLTYLLVPVAIRMAERTGMVKAPGGRHAHRVPTPLLGGVAIAAGIVIAGDLLAPNRMLTLSVLLSLLVGLIDDWAKCRGSELPAGPKLLLQLAPTAVWLGSGNTIRFLSNPLGEGLILLPPYLDYMLTAAWLLGVTNAVNFIDGMDGLAAGVVSVASLSLSLIAMLQGSTGAAIWLAAATGSCLAFLRYNFYPAQVFMGDAGSNFLGFLLAALAVSSYLKTATLAGLGAPLLVLAVPLFNVGFVVFRRMRKGMTLYQALTVGDLEHSFNLVSRRFNLSQPETVLLFVLASSVTSGLGLFLIWRL